MSTKQRESFARVDAINLRRQIALGKAAAQLLKEGGDASAATWRAWTKAIMRPHLMCSKQQGMQHGTQ